MKRILLVGALAVAWAEPAAAQRSPLFMCLQLAPAGLSVETMLSECRLEVQDWMNTCSSVPRRDLPAGGGRGGQRGSGMTRARSHEAGLAALQRAGQSNRGFIVACDKLTCAILLRSRFELAITPILRVTEG